jgi:hypothetical protein
MSVFENPAPGQIVVAIGPCEGRLVELLIVEARRRQWGLLQLDEADQASMRTLLAALVRSLGRVEPPHYTHARRSLAHTLLQRVEGLLVLGLSSDSPEVAAFLRWLASHEGRAVVLGTTAERWATLTKADSEGLIGGLVARREELG